MIGFYIKQVCGVLKEGIDLYREMEKDYSTKVGTPKKLNCMTIQSVIEKLRAKETLDIDESEFLLDVLDGIFGKADSMSVAKRTDIAGSYAKIEFPIISARPGNAGSYMLIVMDSNKVEHYFTEEGYDGNSKPCLPIEEMPF